MEGQKALESSSIVHVSEFVVGVWDGLDSTMDDCEISSTMDDCEISSTMDDCEISRPDVLFQSAPAPHNTV